MKRKKQKSYKNIGENITSNEIDEWISKQDDCNNKNIPKNGDKQRSKQAAQNKAKKNINKRIIQKIDRRKIKQTKHEKKTTENI